MELTEHDVMLIELALDFPEHADRIHRPTITWTVKWLGDWRVGIEPLLWGLARLMVDDGSGIGLTDAWHFPSVEAAFTAAAAWEGPYPGTEPAGWHRHPPTGRRRDDTGREWVQW